MKIPMQKAVDSVVAYLGNQALQIQSMRDRFLMFAALGAAKANSGSLVAPYLGTLTMVGVVDQQGMVSTDAIRSAVDNAFANVPTLSLLGFDFNQADAQELLRMMEA